MKKVTIRKTTLVRTGAANAAHNNNISVVAAYTWK